MITKIDINKFGVFTDFKWNPVIGDTIFERVNIIYGRNYSGKTTLSRIFRCLEKGEVHKNYKPANFKITLDNNTTLSEANLTAYETDNLFRVYNTDFVKENLSWLHKEDGTIEPFTILGSKNIELENEIKEIERKLGNEEENQGLIFQLAKKDKTFINKDKIYKNLEKSLNKKLSDKAREIKNKAELYGLSTYTIASINKDIKVTNIDNILSDEDVDYNKKLLKEDIKKDIKEIIYNGLQLKEYCLNTNHILTKKIKPTEAISEILNDNLLQKWVEEGIKHHKNKREKCSFCGNVIDDNLWGKLDAHFNKESKELKKEIKTQIDLLEKSKQEVKDFLKLSKNEFYMTCHDKYDELFNLWEKSKEKYLENINKLIGELEKRNENIFFEREVVEIDGSEKVIEEIFKKFNQLIEENNLNTNSLVTQQKKAKEDLRYSEVAQFSKNISYFDESKEIESLKEEITGLGKDKNNTKIEINALNEEKRALEAQAKDESKGAELVNEHLSSFFGHDELKLIAESGEEVHAIRFKIMRGNIEANNLSEGECSLISFCYFIAKMEDEMQDNSKNDKLIIYIDDPISSLDSNHIFFMFSLIESIIASPKKYGQLFISTHNLDFLKYIKRITVPDKKVSHFLIERVQKKNEKRSKLVKMPKHIKDYVTEFNYLFNEIYKVAKETRSGNKKSELENTYNQFYNLPNNLRKFLECYLFYKFPNNELPLSNLNKLFDNNVPCLINRVVNEYSHLTYLDRGWKPIDVDEVEECAKIVLDKIKEKDPEQFDALVASIT